MPSGSTELCVCGFLVVGGVFFIYRGGKNTWEGLSERQMLMLDSNKLNIFMFFSQL